jgi:hypothetical protein
MCDARPWLSRRPPTTPPHRGIADLTAVAALDVDVDRLLASRRVTDRYDGELDRWLTGGAS